jgi:hypothetical protein
MQWQANRWRTLQAAEHTQQIEELWTSQVGGNLERTDQLAHQTRFAAQQADVTVTGQRPRWRRASTRRGV